MCHAHGLQFVAVCLELSAGLNGLVIARTPGYGTGGAALAMGAVAVPEVRGCLCAIRAGHDSPPVSAEIASASVLTVMSWPCHSACKRSWSGVSLLELGGFLPSLHSMRRFRPRNPTSKSGQPEPS